MNTPQITVEEYTTPSPTWVRTTDRLPDVWSLMKDHGIRHVLVKDYDENIVGILSARDVSSFSQALDFRTIEAQDVMTREVVTVTPDTELSDVALKMSKQKIGSTVVHDKRTNYLGIFTATDALNALVEVLRGENRNHVH